MLKLLNKLQNKSNEAKVFKNLGEDIAHELRTPLMSLNAGISGIQDCMNKLVSAYQIAVENKISVPEIFPQELISLKEALVNCEKETFYASHYVNLFSANLIGAEYSQEGQQLISIKSCIKQAFYNYPCRGKNQKTIIAIDFDFNDFIIKGVEGSVIKVFANLIKNALLITESGRNEQIKVSTRLDQKYNQVSFINIGKALTLQEVDNLFTRLPNGYSNWLGLFYCKQVMQSMQGDIICLTHDNEKTEFLLNFPKV